MKTHGMLAGLEAIEAARKGEGWILCVWASAEHGFDMGRTVTIQEAEELPSKLVYACK